MGDHDVGRGALVLRIHFTANDLTRVRVAAAPNPLWEVVFSLYRLHQRSAPLAFDRWRRDAVHRADPAALRILMPLTPGGYYPDFLTPAESAQGLDAGIEAILATPSARLRAEMQLLARGRPLPPTLHALGEGDRRALRALTDAIRVHYRSTVAPYWAHASAHVEADRAKRSAALLDSGLDGLLSSFEPLMRWRFPILEADFGGEQDLYLEGRGLMMVPSFLSWGTADALYDPELPPVLVYPVEHDLAMMARGGGDDRLSLEALIGTTRTYVLGGINEGATTSQLARRIGVSAGSISQHTGILRDAGLIRTTRTGKSVLHTLTPLGSALLSAS